MGRRSKIEAPPEPLDGAKELIDHYLFLCRQRNMNGVIDFNVISDYVRIFDVGDEKIFIEIIYEIDRILKKEVK